MLSEQNSKQRINRKIPVFYHIPKNAGTYIGNYALGVFRYFRIHYTDWLSLRKEGETLKVLQILKDGLIIARFFVGDPKFLIDSKSDLLIKQSEIEYDIDVKDLSSEFLDNLFIFFVIIESNGFKLHNLISDLISSYEHFKFLVLRDAFSRAQSLYYYNKSNISNHDYTHGAIGSLTFEDYILSRDLEDSWLIRNFLDIPNDAAIESDDFDKTFSLLKDFHIYHMNNVNTALFDIFKECYRINIGEIEDKFIKDIYKNENTYEKFKLNDLSPHAQSVFRDRTFWDLKLYEQLLNFNTLSE